MNYSGLETHLCISYFSSYTYLALLSKNVVLYDFVVVFKLEECKRFLFYFITSTYLLPLH